MTPATTHRVIPAKAGIHLLTFRPLRTVSGWIPAFAGMTAEGTGQSSSQIPLPGKCSRPCGVVRSTSGPSGTIPPGLTLLRLQ